MSGGYRDYLDSLMREVKSDTSQTLTALFASYAGEQQLAC